MHREVIETSGDYRVVLVSEEEDIAPEQDGETPLLRIDHGHVDFAREDRQYGDVVLTAFQRWCTRPNGDGWNYFTKYMRGYLGVTVIQPWFSENGNWYVAYDTPAWREAAGHTEAVAGPNWRLNLSKCDLIGDWKPYTNGDVWGAMVEKRVTWTTADPAYDDRETWEPVDDAARWVLYGYEYAEAEARELLTEHAA